MATIEVWTDFRKPDYEAVFRAMKPARRSCTAVSEGGERTLAFLAGWFMIRIRPRSGSDGVFVESPRESLKRVEAHLHACDRAFAAVVSFTKGW